VSAKAQVVVIGGGPAGCVCALTLSRLGFEVTLLQSERLASWRFGEVCGPKVWQLLARACGVVPPDDVARPLPFFHACWGSPELSAHAFEFWSAGPARVLDRSAFNHLVRSAAKSGGVDVIEPCEAVACQWDGQSWHIRCVREEEGFELAAHFVVEAVGGRTRSLAYPDAARLYFDDQVCLSIEAEARVACDDGAIVESCPVGWWYACRIDNGRQILALFTDADFVSGIDRQRFMLEQLGLTRFISARATGCCDPAVKVVSARTSIRTLLWRHRWIPAGDAAFSLDPVSGTGIERAVADGVAVAEAIANSLNEGNDAALRAHAEQRAMAFRQALSQRLMIYGLERRWANAPFWRLRSPLTASRHMLMT
jgi:flavin-dependent dehydrogenase